MASYFVANWKSHKTEGEAKDFLDKFSRNTFAPNKKIILCPPTTLLSFVKSYLERGNLQNIEIGAQNISEFSEGPYTGEENAKQIAEFAKYVIIGHSERKKLLGETDETILRKFSLALEAGLIPIVCVDKDLSHLQKLNGKDFLVAYEPISSIGTGIADNPTDASSIASKIKDLGNFTVLYGGSVTSQNVSSFTKEESIDGVLVGGGSLTSEEFSAIIENG